MKVLSCIYPRVVMRNPFRKNVCQTLPCLELLWIANPINEPERHCLGTRVPVFPSRISFISINAMFRTIKQKIKI